MARLRSEARKRAACRQAEAISPSVPPPPPQPLPGHDRAVPFWATEVPTSPTTQSQTLPELATERIGNEYAMRNLVAAMGTSPPRGSQEHPDTLQRKPQTPPYTWERTSPVNGRDSGYFVLHLGPTPQTSPMSRDPPNVIVNRKELQAALRGKITRARRGQGAVKRRSEVLQTDNPATDGTTRGRGGKQCRSTRRKDLVPPGSGTDLRSREHALVAPSGWEPPRIESSRRSPIQLRSRRLHQASAVPMQDVQDQPHEVMDIFGEAFPKDTGTTDLNHVEDFKPGESPPQHLFPNPVHSPSEHTYLEKHNFPKTLHVKVHGKTLDLDPVLVGDGNGLTGLVVSRFYHHVTGTPMFLVDFGDTIGSRSVRVADTTADISSAFGNTQRTLFQLEDNNPCANGEATHCEIQEDIACGSGGPSQVEASDNSGDDPDWRGSYADFHADEEAGGSTSDGQETTFMEDPLQELGIYGEEEDVSSWSFERLFADDQWQSQSVTLRQDVDNFSGPLPGPTSAPAGSPAEYFLQFWPPEVLQRVVQETNRYAAQPSQLNPTVTNGRADWTPLDSEELLAWFGILMLMGLKEFPNIRCYWDRRQFYNCPLISEAMPRKRFEAIIRCLHLVDNEVLVTDRADPAYDKLAKVRWLCEAFTSMSQTLYNNERVLTVDEIMIPYKGRFCNIRQYMKAKPVKFGVKVWALANSESRYVSNIIVYLGADNVRSEGDSVGEDAVLTAVGGLEGRGHVIITDNFFTSPRLFMELMRRGFWATGTCRKTRKGFPSSLAGFANTDLPQRGHLVVKMHRSRNMAAICWMDSKPVFLLSTACNAVGEEVYAGRWVGRERVEFPTSPILLQYQAGMRGVDIVDQQRQEYSTQLHSHKWWHRVFMFVLDSQLLNSYVLYADDRRALGLPVYSRLLWHYTVAEDLIRPRMAAGHIRGPIRNLAAGGLHFSSSSVLLRRRCVVCGRRTRRLCTGCGGTFQCEGSCFRTVHTQQGYRLNSRSRLHEA